MPEIEFDAAHKIQKASDYPKLKLVKHGMKRIFAGLENPSYAWAHDLKAPKIVNGQGVTKEEKRNDGSTYTDIVKDFLSRPHCLGDYGIIKDKGMDPDGCPMCEMAKAGEHVNPPKRRFAMHVIEYGTEHNSTELLDPFSCKLVMWSFTDTIYSELVDIKREWKGLDKNDLLLGPCTNEPFQQYDIKPAASAAWQGDEERKKRVVLTYRNNQAKLPKEDFCGRATARQYIDGNLATIKERWAIVNGAAASLTDATPPPSTASLAQGLDGLLDSTPAPSAPSRSITGDSDKPVDLGAMLEDRAPEADSNPAQALDFSDLLGGDDNNAQTEATPAAPATDSPAPAADEDDFTSLLSGLK